MGILAQAMGEHLARCAEAGYNAARGAHCPFEQPSANDAWSIGRYLRASDLAVPRLLCSLGNGLYEVNGERMRLNQAGSVSLIKRRQPHA